MEAFEETVMFYLTHLGGVFLVPQCSIRDDRGGELTCPDFVALDFRARQVQVVEVKTGPKQRLDDLIRNINDREARWFSPLRAKFKLDEVAACADWSFAVRAFVRRDAVDHVLQRLTVVDGVIVESLEDIAFSWSWQWRKG
jgi:hypothetical protein